MTSDDLTARLQRLEANLAYLDRMVDRLNEALVDQGRLLARLEKRIDALTQALASQELHQPPPPLERPPHYGR